MIFEKCHVSSRRLIVSTLHSGVALIGISEKSSLQTLYIINCIFWEIWFLENCDFSKNSPVVEEIDCVDATQRRRNFSKVVFTVTLYGRVSTELIFEKLHVSLGRLRVCVAVCCSATYATVLHCNTRCIAQHNTFCCMARHVVLHCNTHDGVAPATRTTLRNGGASSRISPKSSP